MGVASVCFDGTSSLPRMAQLACSRPARQSARLACARSAVCCLAALSALSAWDKLGAEGWMVLDLGLGASSSCQIMRPTCLQNLQSLASCDCAA